MLACTGRICGDGNKPRDELPPPNPLTTPAFQEPRQQQLPIHESHMDTRLRLEASRMMLADHRIQSGHETLNNFAAPMSLASDHSPRFPTQSPNLTDDMNKLQAWRVEVESRLQAFEFVAKNISQGLEVASKRLSDFDSKFEHCSDFIETSDSRLKVCEDASMRGRDIAHRQNATLAIEDRLRLMEEEVRMLKLEQAKTLEAANQNPSANNSGVSAAETEITKDSPVLAKEMMQDSQAENRFGFVIGDIVILNASCDIAIDHLKGAVGIVNGFTSDSVWVKFPKGICTRASSTSSNENNASNTNSDVEGEALLFLPNQLEKLLTKAAIWQSTAFAGKNINAIHEKIQSMAQDISNLKDQRTDKIPSMVQDDSDEKNQQFDLKNEGENPDDLHELHAALLDRAQMYQVSESIWDMALFIELPLLGHGVSFVIAIVYALNFWLQLFFCQIIWTYMVSSPIDNKMLDELLWFRVGVAHNVDYADKLQMRSMASRICDGDETLHLAGGQFRMQKDMNEFEEGAMTLCILTIVCWIIKVFGEAGEAVQFHRTVWTIRRSPDTKILTDLEDLEAGEQKPEDVDAEAAKLLRIAVTVKVASISCYRAMFASLLIAAPRAVLAAILGAIGVLYLSVTNRMEDLLLNGMALAFISDIDEIIYVLFVPQRAKTFLANLEPLPCHSKLEHAIGLPWIMAMAKLLTVVGLCIFVTIVCTIPFFEKVKQVTDIMCTGATDFVVAKNKATGLLHVAKSQGSSGWTDSDTAVLQLARPILNVTSAWKFAPTTLQLAFGPVPLAVVESHDKSHYGHAVSISALQMSSSKFEYVAALNDYTIEQASKQGACVDMQAAQSSSAAVFFLRKLLGNNSMQGCFEDKVIIQPLCALMNMSQLRALCPVTCGCDRVLPKFSGFFAHPAWGCPVVCLSTRRAMEGYDLDTRQVRRPCEDIPPPVFFLDAPIEASIDTADKADKDNYFEWFKNYMKGMLEYVSAQPGAAETIERNAGTLVIAGVFPQGEGVASNATRALLNGSSLARILEEKVWEIYPGMKLGSRQGEAGDPIGCSFLASPEVTFLLGVELCADEDFWSLRTVCAKSCGCGAMAGCPLMCGRAPLQPPCGDMAGGSFMEIGQATLQWALDDPSAMYCSDPDIIGDVQEQCGKWNKKALRQVCPLTCFCHIPSFQVIGFFQSVPFGCPQTCLDIIPVVRAIHYTHETCDDQDLLSPSAFFQLWLEGLFSSFKLDKRKSKEVYGNLQALASGIVMPSFLNFDNIPKYHAFVMDGSMTGLILNGSWEILPGVPHPRGLKGCKFMTSYELSVMIGMDLCKVGTFKTLRPLCPHSCRCSLGDVDCPDSC